MSKKPWYIWLSIWAFPVLCFITVAQIVFGSKKVLIINEGHRINLWLRAILQFFFIGLVYIMLPMLLLTILSVILSGLYPILATITNGIQLSAIYLLGVYATYKFDLWRKSNLK